VTAVQNENDGSHGDSKPPAKKARRCCKKKRILKRDAEIIAGICGALALVCGVLWDIFAHSGMLAAVLFGVATVVFAFVPAYYLIGFHSYKALPWGTLPARAAYIVGACSLAGGVVLVASVNSPTAIEDALVPAFDPTPKTACTPNGSKKSDITGQGYFFVTFAGGGVMAITPDKKLTAISIDGQPTVVINRSEKGILLDVDMFNPNGALAVRIEKNQPTVSATQTFKATRPDASTLKVVGFRGEELLWVRYMNANTVKIRGTFYKVGDPQPAVIKDDSIDPGNMQIYMAPTGQPITFVPCFLAWTPDFRDPILVFK